MQLFCAEKHSQEESNSTFNHDTSSLISMTRIIHIDLLTVKQPISVSHTKQLTEQCGWESQASWRSSVSETSDCSILACHDCKANQFVHLALFMIQSHQVNISSGLCTSAHPCEGADGV